MDKGAKHDAGQLAVGKGSAWGTRSTDDPPELTWGSQSSLWTQETWLPTPVLLICCWASFPLRSEPVILAVIWATNRCESEWDKVCKELSPRCSSQGRGNKCGLRVSVEVSPVGLAQVLRNKGGAEQVVLGVHRGCSTHRWDQFVLGDGSGSGYSLWRVICFKWGLTVDLATSCSITACLSLFKRQPSFRLN